jgi:hypothetical protein
MKYKPIIQENLNGCAVACVASLIGKNYFTTLKLFVKKYADTRGYYFKDVISTLKRNGLNYQYSKVIPGTRKHLRIAGSIVFIKRSKKFPSGHYLLKTERGWMNSWINSPRLPIKAGFQKKLPGKAQWVAYHKL